MVIFGLDLCVPNHVILITSIKVVSSLHNCPPHRAVYRQPRVDLSNASLKRSHIVWRVDTRMHAHKQTQVYTYSLSISPSPAASFLRTLAQNTRARLLLPWVALVTEPGGNVSLWAELKASSVGVIDSGRSLFYFVSLLLSFSLLILMLLCFWMQSCDAKCNIINITQSLTFIYF